MKTTTKYLLILFVSLTGCKDGEFYTSQKTISGIVYFNNTDLGNTIPKPADSVTIRLKIEQEGDYLYKVKSDKTGFFEFGFIPDKKSLFVEALGTLDGIDYTIVEPVEANNTKIELKMKPQYKNAVKVTIQKDNGEKWHNTKTFLYRNEFLADSVFSRSDIPKEGFIESKITNQFGVVIYNDLIKGVKYYLVVKDELSGIKLKKKETLEVGNDSLTTASIKIY